jgi:ATP-binding cassette subfamily F protein 3
MIILQATHIYKSYGAAPVLKDATLTIHDRERAGLVGANGAGKSTLLRIITGEIEPDQGQVSKSKDISTGYLSQDSGLESGSTVWEEMLAAFGPLLQQEQELRELEEKMAGLLPAEDKKAYRQVSARYATLSDHFQHAGGYTYKATARSVLQGLSFVEDEHHKIVSTLSGGQKTRLALARLLMLQPDLLILDEPTNYLDIETMDWLEKYLHSYPGAILVVSHDRYFLNNLVNVVYELENSILIKYEGNYTSFLQQKSLRLEQQAREYRQYRAEKARLEDFVRRNIADKATVGRAKSRRKQLEKMQEADQPLIMRKAKISFNIRRPSGKEVLAVRDLSIGYSGQAVARGISFDLARGGRTAILGPNGAGKTTLLKTIAGQLAPLGGEVTEGLHLYPAYHDQELQTLSGDKTVQAELWDAYPDLDEKDVRGILGRFLFPGENVMKKVSTLSGGERARLTLAKLLCAGANLLILDEPTNHLDIYSKEVLEQALLDYPGTLLLVSHDRYFLNRIATRIIELTPNRATIYEGNFDYYQEKKKPPAIVEEVKPEKQPKEDGQAKFHYLQTKEREREDRRRRRRIEELEKSIQETEKLIATIEDELYQPEVYGNRRLYQEKTSQLEQLRHDLDICLEDWVALQEQDTSQVPGT